ncbi:glycerol-3-phosphate dehydrogenase subunit GlpB [Salinarchaeum sp. Harcht-Bsk1]|uniref:glycerol-3-phosphate dehydrogenase subunit GlpB n=1 Tax=Salinarchaeum sp. Harcht-Bsk1 TaxID=1333523 RepID=UPI00067798A4|nr:glycerol-3-phosphate dehydrogenase subunit GlpB [Salinarchaeum sp. Harcht-Bsk1]
MAIDSDVVVIGGGLAGISAALAAADAGAKTRLVTANQSTLRQASGLIDVMGYPPDAAGTDASQRGAPARTDGGPVADPFEHIPDLPEGHPYERVGVDAVRDALAAFDEVVEGYTGEHTDANALVPTNGGAIKPTARYPVHTADGLASDDRDALLVGFESLTDFDAPLAAEHLLAAGVPFAVEGVTVSFPGELRADAKTTRFADLLENDEIPAAKGGTSSGGTGGGAGGGRAGAVHRTRTGSCRAKLVERIDDAIDDATVDPERVGFPAVLGEDRPSAVRIDLSDRLGMPVFEVPTGPPSLPGIRLENQLHEALEARQVWVADGQAVVDFTATDGRDEDRRIEQLQVETPGGGTTPVSAEQYVLATGGLVGRGIDSERDLVREPIFDCHVPHPEDRYDWFADDAFGDHPFAAFGVHVDRSLRPLDADDGIEFENLRAAGSVLGGYDFAAEKSGAGVSIATGHAAGTAAAEEI